MTHKVEVSLLQYWEAILFNITSVIYGLLVNIPGLIRPDKNKILFVAEVVTGVYK